MSNKKVENCPRCHDPVDYVIGFYWQCKNCDLDKDKASDLEDEVDGAFDYIWDEDTLDMTNKNKSTATISVDNNGQLGWNFSAPSNPNQLDFDDYFGYYEDSDAQLTIKNICDEAVKRIDNKKA